MSNLAYGWEGQIKKVCYTYKCIEKIYPNIGLDDTPNGLPMIINVTVECHSNSTNRDRNFDFVGT